MNMVSKRCSRCFEVKTLDLFSKNKKCKDGTKSYCKKCHNKGQREYQKRKRTENPTLWRENRWKKHLKSAYGLSYEEYTKMLETQKGVCKICGKPPEESRDGRLFVDHCHMSLKNRGLLCYQCNTVLGMANDDVTILKKAIEYLDED